MLNTPPTFAWYLAGKVFKWLLKKGGVKSIQKENIIATQFHPEKSQSNGLKLLNNWFRLIESA